MIFSLIGTDLLHILLNPQVLGRNPGQRLVPESEISKIAKVCADLENTWLPKKTANERIF
jgi:hypothetical protein